MTIFRLASVTEERSSAQTWFALGNATFCRLWFASVASGIFVSAQEVTTTWLMHDLGASSFQLSLTAAAASAPFFLFTLPAGAFADIVSRRGVIVGAVLWQGVCVALLALGAWLEKIGPAPVLACIFALGIGIAFAAPVWGAVVPDIVSKEELPSAVTLGGVQQNLAGIVGPALGGFLLPVAGRANSYFDQCPDVSGRGGCRLVFEVPPTPAEQASGKLFGIVHQFSALRPEFAAHKNDPAAKRSFLGGGFFHSRASSGDCAQGIESLRGPARSSFHLRRDWLVGGGDDHPSLS